MDSIAVAIRRFLNSPGFKFFLIGGLILVLTIPMILVWVLVSEREQRAASVRLEVAHEWGGAADHQRSRPHRPLHGPARDGAGREPRRGADRAPRRVPSRDAQRQRQGDDEGAAPRHLRRGGLHRHPRLRGAVRCARHERGRARRQERALARCGPRGRHQRRVRPQDGGVGDHRRRSEASLRAEPRRARGTRRRHSRPRLPPRRTCSMARRRPRQPR